MPHRRALYFRFTSLNFKAHIADHYLDILSQVICSTTHRKFLILKKVIADQTLPCDHIHQSRYLRLIKHPTNTPARLPTKLSQYAVIRPKDSPNFQPNQLKSVMVIIRLIFFMIFLLFPLVP